MGKFKVLDWIAYVLVTIGALNWGILGITNLFKYPFNLVQTIFGNSWFVNVVYILVGFAGIYSLYRMKKISK